MVRPSLGSGRSLYHAPPGGDEDAFATVRLYRFDRHYQAEEMEAGLLR